MFIDCIHVCLNVLCVFSNSFHHQYIGRDRRWAINILEGSAESINLSYIHAYNYTVMGNELDKIEQNGDQIAQHMRISEAAGQQLKEDVKVGLLFHWNIMCNYKI